MSQDRIHSKIGQVDISPLDTSDSYPGGVGLGNHALILAGRAAGRGGALAQSHFPASGSATSIASSFEIVHSGMANVVVSVSGATTSNVLQAGYHPGQSLTVMNQGGSSITFAAAATSRVVEGTNAVIQSFTAAEFRWCELDSRWYKQR